MQFLYNTHLHETQKPPQYLTLLYRHLAFYGHIAVDIMFCAPTSFNARAQYQLWMTSQQHEPGMLLLSENLPRSAKDSHQMTLSSDGFQIYQGHGSVYFS
jgi:hypothetical protein